jgi:hypothetical protein
MENYSMAYPTIQHYHHIEARNRKGLNVSTPEMLFVFFAMLARASELGPITFNELYVES